MQNSLNIQQAPMLEQTRFAVNKSAESGLLYCAGEVLTTIDPPNYFYTTQEISPEMRTINHHHFPIAPVEGNFTADGLNTFAMNLTENIPLLSGFDYIPAEETQDGGINFGCFDLTKAFAKMLITTQVQMYSQEGPTYPKSSLEQELYRLIRLTIYPNSTVADIVKRYTSSEDVLGLEYNKELSNLLFSITAEQLETIQNEKNPITNLSSQNTTLFSDEE